MSLKSIISILSLEEKQRFIQYLEKKNKRTDTKNIQLFKLLSNDELSSKTISTKIYPNGNKTAYHALRKRLNQSLIDFITSSNLEHENSNDMQLIKLILASRTFLLHNKTKIAYKTLNKAEILAKEHALFPILNEIYHTKIQYAYTNPLVDLDSLIKQFKENQKNQYHEEELNLVYARLRQAVNNMTYKGDIVDFQDILSTILKEHNISLNDSMSFKSLYQLMKIVSLSAFATKDYLNIESFLIKTYNAIILHKSKDKQLYYHIEVLYMIANTFFRNKKFKDSLKYLDLMQKTMQLNRKKYHNTFKLKHTLLLALNYNFLHNQIEAIQLLEPVTKVKHPDLESLLDIHLSLVMFYIQKAEFHKAYSIFKKFYHTDNYYIEKAGKEWIIKKHLAEIILHIELQNVDFVESRILSFKRIYGNYLKQIGQERVLTFLSLVESFYKNPETVTTKPFYDNVKQSFKWTASKKEDIFVMSFYAWLKSKMEKGDLYETTLALIN